MTEKFEALKAGHSFDFCVNKKPKCPHCGEDFDISDNEAWFLYDEDRGPHDVDCPDCHLPFSVSAVAHWSFSTDEQEDDQ